MTDRQMAETMIAKLTDEKLIEAYRHGRTVDAPGAETAMRMLQAELARRWPRRAWLEKVGA